ncbi:MAG: metallophosphoesterase family protein [Thermoleophilia bacterium]|nr:metallophosphatase family protein [Actinomycetota bacterium]
MRAGTDSASPSTILGVISDTHGLLDPRVLPLFAGVDGIVHAGDIGSSAVLEGLRALAPVTAVRGNVDRDGWAWDLSAYEEVEAGGRRLLVGHICEQLLRDHDPAAEGYAAVIVGHSHAPEIAWREGVLYFNPGSAGRRRFHLPRAVGLLEITAGVLRPRIVVLEEGAAPRS